MAASPGSVGGEGNRPRTQVVGYRPANGGFGLELRTDRLEVMLGMSEEDQPCDRAPE